MGWLAALSKFSGEDRIFSESSEGRRGVPASSPVGMLGRDQRPEKPGSPSPELSSCGAPGALFASA